jgi:hypothetical protein
VRPYYIVPDGKVGHDAYAVIRETTMLGAIDWGFRVILVTDALCSSADETHDAMMNIYMNRFGKQVETVTTQTLLALTRKNAGAESVMSAGPSHLVQILLPKKTGSGRPIRKEWFDGFFKNLTDKFGGATNSYGARDRVSGKAAARPRKTT